MEGVTVPTDPEDLIPKGFPFVFPAVIDEWHDGDTPYVHRATQPGEMAHGEHIRVQGIDAPELSGAGGRAARDFAAALLPPDTLVMLTATKKDKYGRFLAKITMPDGQDFGEVMIHTGHAVPYMT
jgi:endonuclease YncB( thermonuclease family)